MASASAFARNRTFCAIGFVLALALFSAMGGSAETAKPVQYDDAVLKATDLRYRLDSERSSIEFKVGPISGRFRGVDASLGVALETTKASLEVTITMASVDVDNRVLESMLRTKDWFDVEEYPYATFTVDNSAVSNPGSQVTGILVIKGINRPLRLDVSFPEGEPAIDPPSTEFAFVALSTFSRSAFDMGQFPSMAEDLVEVRVAGVFRREVNANVGARHPLQDEAERHLVWR